MDEAREAAWASYRSGPLFSPRGNTNHGATKRPFSAGFDAGVAEGIRQAREAVEVENRSRFGVVRGFQCLRAIDALGDA